MNNQGETISKIENNEAPKSTPETPASNEQMMTGVQFDSSVETSGAAFIDQNTTELNKVDITGLTPEEVVAIRNELNIENNLNGLAQQSVTLVEEAKKKRRFFFNDDGSLLNKEAPVSPVQPVVAETAPTAAVVQAEVAVASSVEVGQSEEEKQRETSAINAQYKAENEAKHAKLRAEAIARLEAREAEDEERKAAETIRINAQYRAEAEAKHNEKMRLINEARALREQEEIMNKQKLENTVVVAAPAEKSARARFFDGEGTSMMEQKRQEANNRKMSFLERKVLGLMEKLKIIRSKKNTVDKLISLKPKFNVLVEDEVIFDPMRFAQERKMKEDAKINNTLAQAA